MQSIILVGGQGTRLRPLTYETPKQMLPLLGTPMIEVVFSALARHGVTDAVLSLGYLPNQFMEAYPSGSISGIRVQYAVEPEPLDTAGAIRFAAAEADIEDTFLVINGDVLTEIDVTSLLAFHRDREAGATIALHPVDDPSRFGVVASDERGQVSAFIEKPPREEAPSNTINAGVYLFEPSVLSHIASGRKVSVEREVFPALVARGELYAQASDAYWLDTGTPTSYIQANTDVLSGIHTLSGLDGVTNGSWIHEQATVESSAQLHHAVVDANCLVGAGVVLERAILLPGAVIGAGAVVKDSIVGPGATIGPRSELHATCVVGANEHVASNSRLSGDVRLGGV